MELLFTIPGELTDLNKYIQAERTPRIGYRIASQIKRDMMLVVAMSIRSCYAGGCILDPIHLHFIWYVKNTRKDPDNISFGKKYILDAMQEEGVIENDSMKQIRGFQDEFIVDARNPRIEVYYY